MNDTDFLHLLMRHQDGTLTPDELAAFETAMRDDPAKRQLFAETQLRSMALHDRFRQEAFQSGCGFSRTSQRKRFTWITRPITAMAAGLVIGLFSASIVWAISSPKATTERLFSLLNGSFDENRLERGFPHQLGFWSGDEAAIRDDQLCFIAPSSDSGDPTGRAISCDVFQLVDLRPLRHALSPEGDSVLELSSDFRDGRAANTKPSVSFFGQLYLFSGDPASLHQKWPQSIPEALASGSAQVTTLGSDAKGVRTLNAKCLIPAQADFAVIQISARPNLRPAKLDQLSADNVKLTLKNQPTLPVRIVQR
ncbi:MAG: hypothetical protein QE570_01885 [Verrucomicrobiota bacterium]|nr:hypothetical protein [Verrucomicrobiota bacterium]